MIIVPNENIQSIQNNTRKQRTEYCPLCNKSNRMKSPKLLYDHPICSKCYYNFANRRQLAFGIDSIVWYFIMYGIGLIIGFYMASSGSSISEIKDTVNFLSFLFFFIFICKDCFSGQSIGKLICGIKVIDNSTGLPGNLQNSFKRNLPLFIPFMGIFIAFQLCKGHRIGDIWSNTKVIWNRYSDNKLFLPENPNR